MTDGRPQEKLAQSRRRLLQLLAATGGAGMTGLAGCTGGGGDGGGGEETTGNGDGSSGDGGGSSREVHFLTEGVGENIKPFFEENNAKFEQERGIDLTFSTITWDNAQSTLTTRVRGGKAPDIARWPSRWIPQFINMDGIVPLDDVMQGDFKDRFYPKVAQTSRVDGKYYGVPWALSNKVLYYNKDVFEEAGLDPENPTLDSWDDMLDAAQQIKENTDTPAYGLPAADNTTTVSQWYPYHWSHGANIIDDDGNAALNTEKGIEALDFYSSLVTEHGVTQPSPLSSRRNDVRELFEQGQVALHIGHVYVGINIRDNETGVNYGTVQVPKGPGGRYNLATTDSLVIFKQSENKEEAKELIDFYYDTERRFQYSKTKGFLPVIEEVGNRPYFSESEIWSPFLKANETARARPKLLNMPKFENIMITAIQQTVSGKMSAEEALNQAQSDFEDLLADSG